MITASDPKTSEKVSPLVLFFIGVAMGIGYLVPGISSATVILILGNYEQLLYSIRSFDKVFLLKFLRLEWKDAFGIVLWKFLILLGSGVICSFLLFSNFLERMLASPFSRIYLYAFFFGMIVASIKALKKKIVYWKTPQFIALFLGVSFSLWSASERLLGFETMNIFFPLLDNIFFWEPLKFVLLGFLFIPAMFVPGLFTNPLFFSSTMQLQDTIAFFSGVIIGLIAFTRVLLFLMKKFRDRTLAFLFGVLLGSLPAIWPFGNAIHRACAMGDEFCVLPNRQIVFVILLLLAGYFLFSLVQKRQGKAKKSLLIPE